MRKFIGNVNGVEFTDVDKFNEAVKKAVENNESPMFISSYYKDCECLGECECGDDCDCKKLNNEKKEFDVNILLIDSDSERCGDDNYKVPVNVKELLENASNRGKVIDKLFEELNVYQSRVDNLSVRMSKIASLISEKQDELKELEKMFSESNHKYDYYKEICDNFVDEYNSGCCGTCCNNNTDTDDEQDKDENAEVNKQYVFNALGELVGSLFGKYLNDKGFWKV